MKTIHFIKTVIIIAIFLCTPTFAATVYKIELNDNTINPATAEYIVKAIDIATAKNAECLIIQMDTPGGLLSSTRLIVKKMLVSKVPLVVYIAPNGSRAGSAGVFITYASHIAAMAPSTNIGAAHPVQLGGEKQPKENEWEELKDLLEDIKSKQETPQESKEKKSEDKDEAVNEKAQYFQDENPMESKILNDTVAFIKSIAKERNRNEEWAIESVVKSASITAQEALEKKVVELIAQDTADLLSQINGREVTIDGKIKKLNTKNADVLPITMDARQKIFNALADPNIVYILFILGFYGLLYEITHPGFGVPGILGAIFLIVAFYSMQALPTNYAGLSLLVLGLILMIAEAITPGFGMLALGGMVALVLGSLLLFDSPDPAMDISTSVIIAVATISGILILYLLRLVLRTRKRRSVVGAEGMIGETGEVFQAIHPGKEGKIYVHGEIWNASADEYLSKGTKVKVFEVNKLLLKVKKDF